MGSNSGTTTTHLLGNPEDSPQGVQVTHEHPAVTFDRKRRNAAVHGQEIGVEPRGHWLEKGQPVLQLPAKRHAPRSADAGIGDDPGDLSSPKTKQNGLLVDHDGKIQRAPPSDHRQLGVRGDGLTQSLKPAGLRKDRWSIHRTTHPRAPRAGSPGRRRSPYDPRPRTLAPRQPARSGLVWNL